MAFPYDDTEQENPYDANYNFGFLDSYLQNASKNSNADVQAQPESGDFYDVEDTDEEPTVAQAETAEQTPTEQPAETGGFFDEQEEDLDHDPFVAEFMSQNRRDRSRIAGSINSGAVSDYTPQSGAVQFKPGVTGQGLKTRAGNVLDELSGQVGNVLVTSTTRSASGNRSVGGVNNSFHLSGDAVDLRPSENLNAFLSSSAGRSFLQERGYEAVDERGKQGSAHWHLEPVSRKYGGGAKVAETKREQYIGLNDDSFDEMFLPLTGYNTIRGLDSGNPVSIVDDNGHAATLYGPNDTFNAFGGVHERRGKKRKYQTGGQPHLSETDKDTQESMAWLYNWYDNRKVDNAYLNNLIEQERSARRKRFSKGVTVSEVPRDEMPPDSIGQLDAYYTTGTDKIVMSDDLEKDDKKSIMLHEVNHFADDIPRRSALWDKVVIGNNIPTAEQSSYSKDVYDYISDPKEIKSRLMQLRKKANFKPDQTVTIDDLNTFLKDVDPDPGIDSLMPFLGSDETTDHTKRVQRLLMLLNNTVKTKKKDSNNAEV